MFLLQVTLFLLCLDAYQFHNYSLDGECGEQYFCTATFYGPGTYRFERVNLDLRRLMFDRFTDSVLDASNVPYLDTLEIQYPGSSGVLPDNACNIIVADKRVCVNVSIGLGDRERVSCCTATSASTTKPVPSGNSLTTRDESIKTTKSTSTIEIATTEIDEMRSTKGDEIVTTEIDEMRSTEGDEIVTTRESSTKGDEMFRVQSTETSTSLDILWTIAPALIMFVMLVVILIRYIIRRRLPSRNRHDIESTTSSIQMQSLPLTVQ